MFVVEICHSVGVTSQVWFDGDEIFWDRPEYQLSEMLESQTSQTAAKAVSPPALYPDVLPTFMALSHVGTANLVQYLPMPAECQGVLPPFTRTVSDFAEVSGDDVVLVGKTLEHFPEATAKGWLTVWLNRDRSANLTGVLPDAEIHSMLDLPDVVESMVEARARALAVLGQQVIATDVTAGAIALGLEQPPLTPS